MFQTFYLHMNPEEMLWVIRIVLKQMKIGASENTIFYNFHPDAEACLPPLIPRARAQTLTAI